MVIKNESLNDEFKFRVTVYTTKLLIYKYSICAGIVLSFTRDTTYCPPHKERKYAVFESALMSLFALCFTCLSTKITAISIQQHCKSCGAKFNWSSQPTIGKLPGNILLTAAILFAGALPRKVLRVMDFFGLQSISLSTFFKHQKSYLLRTINNVWEKEESVIFDTLGNKPLVLGGDGRNDSMGHCAKYDSYTLMELGTNKILNIQLVM